MTPGHRRAARAVEKQRRTQLANAIAFLEKHPEYPGVVVQAHVGHQRIEGDLTDAAKVRLSPARLEYALKLIDNTGEAFLQLVKDLDHEKAFITILDDTFRQAWEHFSGMPLASVPPTSPFDPMPPGILAHR